MAYAADQTQLSAQSNARSGPIVRFIWHHQAGTNDDATIGAMVSGSRQVSATWTVSNTGRITAVVPENRRPWTSASYADDGALTVECANSSGPPDYGISDASHEACARLAAYAHAAYGIPLQRATAANGWRGHMGHNEVVGAFGDGYATACPMHLDIDRIITLASDGSTLGGGALSEEEDGFMAGLSLDQQQETYNRLIVMEAALGDLAAQQGLTPQQMQENYNRGKVIEAGVSSLLARPVSAGGTGASAADVAKAVVDMLDDSLATEVADLLSKRLAA